MYTFLQVGLAKWLNSGQWDISNILSRTSRTALNWAQLQRGPTCLPRLSLSANLGEHCGWHGRLHLSWSEDGIAERWPPVSLMTPWSPENSLPLDFFYMRGNFILFKILFSSSSSPSSSFLFSEKYTMTLYCFQERRMKARLGKEDLPMRWNQEQVISLDHEMLNLEDMLWKEDSPFLNTMHASHREHKFPPFHNSHSADDKLTWPVIARIWIKTSWLQSRLLLMEKYIYKI